MTEFVAPALRGAFESTFVYCADGLIEGRAFDANAPDRRFVVEILLDGEPWRVALANLFDDELFRRGVGDGRYGYFCKIDEEALPFVRRVAVRLANSDHIIGVHTIASSGAAPARLCNGEARWAGGLRLTGWTRRRDDGAAPLIEARCSGMQVATTRARDWIHAPEGDEAPPAAVFDLHLPQRLADGLPKRVDVICDGRPLAGSPVALVAFADGLETFLRQRARTDAEQARGRLYDLLYPACTPFADFALWEKAHSPGAAGAPRRSSIAVAVLGGAGDQPPRQEELRRFASLSSQDGGASFLRNELEAFLRDDAADVSAIFCAPGGVHIRPGALQTLAAVFDAQPDAQIVYTDVLIQDARGRLWPIAHTAFDREQSLEQATGALCFAMRREAVLSALREGADSLFDLWRRCANETNVWHQPGFAFVLPPLDVPALSRTLAAATEAQMASRGVVAKIESRDTSLLPAVRLQRMARKHAVAFFIHGARDAEDCVAIRARVASNVGDANAPPELLFDVTEFAPAGIEALERRGFAPDELHRSPLHTKRFARFLAAAHQSRGERICYFDARLRPADGAWLATLLGRLEDDATAAAAPVILHADATIAEAGQTFAPDGRLLPRFDGRPIEHGGYAERLAVAHRITSLDPLCFVLRRDALSRALPLDPALATTEYAAADFFMTLQAQNLALVLDPDARLTCIEAGIVRRHDSERFEFLARRDAALFRARWIETLANDPFYNPLLNVNGAPFTGLASPPRDVAPRRGLVKAPTSAPKGLL